MKKRNLFYTHRYITNIHIAIVPKPKTASGFYNAKYGTRLDISEIELTTIDVYTRKGLKANRATLLQSTYFKNSLFNC